MKKYRAEKPEFKVNQVLEYWTKLKKAANWAEAVSGVRPYLKLWCSKLSDSNAIIYIT